MKIEASDRVKSIGSYAFDEVDKEVSKLKAKGIFPIDFGVGDPIGATPNVIRSACKRAVDKRKSAGYPSYIGVYEFRSEVSRFMKNRFGVELDANKEIASSIGSKEAIFNFHEGFVNPGDYVLVPNPGYPPYARGTLFAEGKTHFMNLLPENDFFPDFEKIPSEVADKAKIMWLNYPNNPTTKLATKEFYEKAIAFCKKHEIILACDEPYTENYYDKKPISILQLTKEGVVVFQSLSKMSNMTCYRIGWVCGDEKIIDVYKKVKTNVDSGTPTFIQDAAVAALEDENHGNQLRDDYKAKRKIMIKALTGAGLPDSTPEGTIYIWQKVPEGYTSVDFAKKLLEPDIAVVTTPGAWISSEVDGVNPGEGYVRFALVPSIDEVKEAAERISKHLKL